MFRTLLSGLLALAFVAEASAQTTPPAPATVRRTTQQQTTTTERTASKPGRTTVRKSNSKKVGLGAPVKRTGAVVTRNRRAAAAPAPASGKGQGVYAAPGKPVNIQGGATVGYDGAATRRPKANTPTTLTPGATPTPRQAGF